MSDKYAVIQAHRDAFRVRPMCDALGVSVSRCGRRRVAALSLGEGHCDSRESLGVVYATPRMRPDNVTRA